MPVFAGLIAANLPHGSEVLTATGDFTSILFPFYAQSGRGICLATGLTDVGEGWLAGFSYWFSPRSSRCLRFWQL